MMFGAFLGSPQQIANWRANLSQHAAWLGLSAVENQRLLAKGDVLAWAWLTPDSAPAPHVCETEDEVCLQTALPPLRADHAATGAGAGAVDNVIRVRVALPTGQIEVTVPLATPEPFYFGRDERGWMLANDFRWMLRWLSFQLAPQAAYALFQFGAIPAPYTLARGVQRIPSGHRLVVRADEASPCLVLAWPGAGDVPEDRGPNGGLQPEASNAEARVLQAVDNMLRRLPPAPALLFSGGVDSSLLAARLVALGFSNVQLFNYSFGPEDAEAQQAQRVAAHLGLACQTVPYRPGDVLTMLDRIGVDYSFPFGDRSVIPTNMLIHAAVGHMAPSSTVLDGTGADGAFGSWTPQSRIAALPRPVRHALAGAYAWLGLWQQPSEAERVGRLARGSLQMPAPQASVAAQNALDGIAYHLPGPERQDLAGALRAYVEVLSVGLAPEVQLSLLDLVHVCAGIFAAKTFDPLRTAGLRPLYPFLESTMVHLSTVLPYAEKTAPGESKRVLKRLLERHLPRSYIERPKSGFVPPLLAILREPTVQAYTREVTLSAQNPLQPYYESRVVGRMFDRTAAGQPLSNSGYKFLWALIFASCWLRQVVR